MPLKGSSPLEGGDKAEMPSAIFNREMSLGSRGPNHKSRWELETALNMKDPWFGLDRDSERLATQSGS